MNIGFIGLGIMGKPMAKNVLKAGHTLVVYDIVEAPVQELVAAGATAGSSPKDVAARNDLIIAMLPNSPHVKKAVLGEGGVIEGAKPGSVLVDMSSIAPLTSREVAAELAGQLALPVSAHDAVPEAVAGADIVVTATTSPRPVLRRAWLSPGTHVNAVGACLPGDREIDTATMAEAALFADSRESVRHESGDYLLAQAEGAVNPVRAELGELLAGTAQGRAHAGQITLFESLGLAAEDLAAAGYVYRTAQRLGAGTSADF